MAHELELQNGEYSFLEVGQVKTAWHQLGRLLPTAPATLDELFTIAPWLDYPVEKLATSYTIDGVTTESAKAFVTVRRDTGKELGAVGADYTPVQNRDAFRAAIGPMIDAGVMQVETSGVLRDGADAFVLGRFNIEQFGPVVKEVFADEVVPYALVSANHSGRRGNLIQLTPVRVVCANTLAASESDAKARSTIVIHTGDAEAKMVAAAQDLFGGIIERYEVIARQYKLLKATYLDTALFRSLVVVPTIGIHPTRRAEFNPEAKLADRVVERYEQRRDTIEWLWTGGKGHTGDLSAWEAYNGVVEAIDHNEAIFPAKSGVYRLGALLDGQLREKKQTALNRLVDFASLRPDEQDARERNDQWRGELVLAK